MPDLAALLVEAGAASAEDVERALARQRAEGGALDTALLELALLPEGELVGFLSRASGLPATPAEPIEPDPRARRVFPARVAERYGLAPFRLDGRELSLLATYPADLAALDEISFMLSLHLVPHVAPEWRVRDLMARTYGVALPERFAALAEGARSAHLPSPSPEPPPAPEPGSDPAAARAEGAADSAPDADPGRAETDEPLAAALAQAFSATDPEALLHDGSASRSQRDAPPHWSREDAFAALEAAQGREGVVAVALRYARDFFDAAALFAVTRERVSGQDAVGWQGARARCRSLEVAPEAVGLFRAAIETRGPYLGPVAREPGNDAMLATLGRPWPRIALVYPVALRDRTVCILYADNGDAPVSPGRLGDFLLLAGGLGGAFERVLRQAKRIRAVAPPLGGRPPPHTGRAEEASSKPAVEARRPAVPEQAPPVETGWELREAARVADPAPSAANGAPEPFHVTRAADALAPPSPFDPAAGVQRLCGTRRGSAERGRLLAQLVQCGPDAAAALRAAFPGPLDVPPSQVEAVPVEERGPVLTALSALGIVATPYLVHLLLEADAERRRLAAMLLGRTRDPATFLPLADRAFDPDAGVREAALGALARARRHPDFRPVLERLRTALLGDEPERAAQASLALARLGDAEAVPLLIEALDGPEQVSEAAGDALEFLTCRRSGRDARRWLAWWREHKGQHRVDWLFSALADDDREVRLAAAERLREVGFPPLPWLADASPAQRSEAVRSWRSWWDEHGQPV